jgi:periplasmic protein TonB
MRTVLEGGDQLERELVPERVGGPAMGSIVLHLTLLLIVAYYGWLFGLFHSSVWGSQNPGGAMQATLVSTAIPLPNNQPLNKNVLSTETPSPAPAPPSPKEQHQVDQTAIPIQGKQEKPKKQTTPKTPLHQPPPPQRNLAQYGSQEGTNIPHTMQPATPSNQPVTVAQGDFGSRFPWYVDMIKRKVAQNWYRGVVDTHTPSGASAQIYFRVGRDGQPSDFRINVSSGSPTLDRSCLEATERVDTFGPLPSGANDQWLDVTYNCTY